MDTFNGKKFFFFGIVLFVVKTITPLKRIQLFCDIAVGMLSISIIFLYIIFLEHCGNLCRKKLIKIGSISLESYLFNIFLLQGVQYWDSIFLSKTGFVYRLILYIIISSLGIALSFCSKMLLEKHYNLVS